MSKAIVGYLAIMAIALTAVVTVVKPSDESGVKNTVQSALEKRKQALDAI
jgi:hypothetical protein